MDLVFKRTSTAIRSRYFFWAILGFFIFESAWIALSATYPMAFDENFHFGLIKTYAHYWLPFLNSQPPGADAYGAVPRDPSYLYHYLMSFPYRLIAQVVRDQTIQIIILRLINIGLFASGIVLFRQVLLRSRLSVTFVSLALVFFVLLPVVPLLAGQVNYDNLLFPLVAWACLLTLEITDELQSGNPPVRTALTLLIVCISATLVKYEFLPIFAGIVLFLLYTTARNSRVKWHQLILLLRKSWENQTTHTRILLVTLLVISVILFAQRDGVNLIQYHTFTPNCSTVLSIESCSKYGPWEFNYHDHKIVENDKANGKLIYENPLSYTGWWTYWLWYRTFFAVNGPETDFTNYPPLPLPAMAGALVGIGGIIAICVRWRYVFRNNPYSLLFSIISVIYLIALWAEGYMQYRYTGVFEYMNGRYLLPILLLVVALMGRSITGLFRKLPILRASLVILLLIFFLEGGGFLTFIMRSNAKWDWPNSYAINVNDAARKVLHPITVEGKKTYTTKVWMFN